MSSFSQTARFYLQTARDSVTNRLKKNVDVFYVADQANWVIKRIGDYLNWKLTTNVQVTISVRGIRDTVIHYGTPASLWNERQIKFPHPSNKIIVTWFHVVNGDGKPAHLSDVNRRVSLWHTACEITKEKLVGFGIPKDKIVVIPLGVDTELFSPASLEEKIRIRQSLGLPLNKIIIGSFQKDGVGWGQGMQPKIIKGPDVFCDVVTQVAKHQEIFVLLTGPARGYVKERLKAAGIPFGHFYPDQYDDVARFYKALDLYLVAAREEGGPLATLESLASGIPLVSTRVGLVPEVIQDGINGFIAEVEDVNKLTEKTLTLLNDQKLQEQFVRNGLATIPRYSWDKIIAQYDHQLYQRLC